MDEGWTDIELYRLIVRQLQRSFHSGTEADRQTMLANRPHLTNTKWDAALAAVIEHAALTHGYDAPAWVDEPERFLPEVSFELIDRVRLWWGILGSISDATGRPERRSVASDIWPDTEFEVYFHVRGAVPDHPPRPDGADPLPIQPALRSLTRAVAATQAAR